MSPKGRFALINKSKFPKRASDERSQIIPGVVRILRHPHTHTRTLHIYVVGCGRGRATSGECTKLTVKNVA